MSKQSDEHAARRRIDLYLEKCRDFVKPPITIEEIADYMKPSHRQIAPFLPLFAEKGLNSASIFELKTDMLVQGNGDTWAIQWDKQRAGRELKTPYWKMGNGNARTLPRAWRILEAITSSIRQDAADGEKFFLIICARSNVGDHADGSVSHIKNNVTMRILNKCIKASTDARWADLRMLNCDISLKKVRVTAGGLERDNKGFKAAQVFFNHSAPATTDHYLKNPIYKSLLDDEIYLGQIALYEHLTSRPELISGTAEEVAAKANVDTAEAKALLDDELNIGFGISLVRERSYVVDTPLNYLRMRGWLHKMESAAERLYLENAERFEGYWRRQIEIFAIALQDFPRKTRREAESLAVSLSFPEPH